MPRRFPLAPAGLALVTALLTTTACGPAATAPTAPSAPATSTPAAAAPSGEDGFGLAPVDEQTPTGGDVTPPLPEGQPTPPAQPSAEDCVSFNPLNLTVAASGDAWVLRDGSHAMALFDTQADANDGRQVARNWTQLCFIGRGNQQADRYRYIITYFKTGSGVASGYPTNDCINYNPATLTIYSGAAHPADPDQADFALYAGPVPLLFLADEPDALRAKLVAAGNSKLCLIGHGNSRPNPTRYQLEYFRA